MDDRTPWVVIAWTDQILEWDQQPFAADLGQQARTVPATKAHACVWKRHATPEDLERARRFVKAEYPETGRVYVYTAGSDPLARAKRDILAGKPQN